MFSSNYRDARDRFYAVARARGFDTAHYPLAGARGLEGEELSIDVASKGSGNRLILTSAIHGVEGFAGSACQVVCMKALEFDGLQIVVIHAVNPYGFSCSSRANENRVDLNRNFSGVYPPGHNPAYSDVHGELMRFAGSDVVTPPDRHSVEAWLTKWEDALGIEACTAAIMGGQYRHDDGLFYGGREPQPSLKLLEKVFTTHCDIRADRSLTIDFHTGLGPRGRGEPIFTGKATDEAFRRARCWLGDEVTCPDHGRSATQKVVGSAENFFAGGRIADHESYVALEFGTVPLHDMLAALCGDIWLRNRRSVDSGIAATIRRDLRAAFCGQDDAWRALVLDRAAQLVTRAAAAMRGGPNM